MNRAGLFLAALIALVAPPSAAIHFEGEGRKTTARDLSVDVQRHQLANGLVLVLAPDPTASSVAVWTTFRAGALYEPPGRSGIAHLVEHVMSSGPTPDTDYDALLERRRARYSNAHTDIDSLTFESVVPPEELPLALWVAADRLSSLPPLVDDALVERHRRVVLQERALRFVDAPYGLVHELLFKRLCAAPHPLHGAVIGVPEELARVTAADVRAFAARLLVPANAILIVVGNFDPAVARRLVEEGLGRLPSGSRARTPAVAPLVQALVDQKQEVISREPRVTMAWRFSDVPHSDALTLELGSQLLSLLTDGAWGMRLEADTLETAGETIFTLELTVPYDEEASAVQDDAEGFLRILTLREMPFDLLVDANLALDRSALFSLDSLEGRAAVLSRLERMFGSKVTVSEEYGAHWKLGPVVVHDTARVYLKAPRVVVHARPIRPRPAGRQ